MTNRGPVVEANLQHDDHSRWIVLDTIVIVVVVLLLMATAFFLMRKRIRSCAKPQHVNSAQVDFA